MADMGEYQRLMQEQRRGTSAQFPMLPPELQPSGEDPLQGAGFGELTDEQKEALLEERALAQKIADRDTLEGVSDYGEQTLSEAPGRIARGAKGLYQVTDEAAAAALNYPRKVFADPVEEARRAHAASVRAERALVDLGKAAASGDPEAIRDAADLTSMTPGTGVIPDLVSAGASYAKAFDSENPGEDVLWGTMSLATLPFRWLSTDALKKAAKRGIKQSAPAQGLQSSVHNLDKKLTGQLKRVDADLAAGKLTPENADLYRTQIETEGRRLVGDAEKTYTATLAREHESATRLDIEKLKPHRGPSLLETLMPPGVMATFRAYPDTQATKNARSVAEGINRRLNAHAWTGRHISPEQAREELKQLSAYAEHAERQAGDVVGQAQERALHATRTKKKHKVSDDPRVDPTRAQKQVAQEEAASTSVSQPMEWEKTYRSGTGKARRNRKPRPGARLDLQDRKKAWREAGRKGPDGKPIPEPKLTDADYHDVGTKPKPYQEGAKTGRMAPESPEFEPLHEKRIREREELLAAKNQAEQEAYDPLSTAIRQGGQRMDDVAASKAQYQGERRAMRRNEQWNDAELALIEANPRGDNLDLLKERIYKIRQDGGRIVQKEDGSFVISGERSLIGGEDMPEVDPDFLKVGKESDARMGRQRGSAGPARDVKLSPEELSTLRRNQIRQAKPLVSGSAGPADKLRDLNTQIRDIGVKLDADKILEKRFPGRYGGTLQRELRNDLAQALDGREQLLRGGDMQPPRGRFAAIDDLEAEADRLLAPDAAAKRKVAAEKRKVAAENRPVKPPPPTDPRAINRTRRARLTEASEARAGKPKAAQASTKSRPYSPERRAETEASLSDIEKELLDRVGTDPEFRNRRLDNFDYARSRGYVWTKDSKGYHLRDASGNWQESIITDPAEKARLDAKRSWPATGESYQTLKDDWDAGKRGWDEGPGLFGGND